MSVQKLSQTQSPPRLRDSVVIGETFHEGLKPVAYLHDSETGQFLRLGAREAALVALIDGRRTVDDLERLLVERHGFALKAAGWSRFLDGLRQQGVLTSSSSDEISATAARVIAKRRQPKKSFLTCRFPMPRVAGLVPYCARLTRWLWHPVMVILGSCLGLIVSGWTVWNSPRLIDEFRAGAPFWATAPGVFLVTLAVMFLHELGHGVVCHRFGGKPREIGLLWRFPLVLPYCNIDDIMVQRRGQRVMACYAGIYVNLLAMVPYWLLWRIAETETWYGSVTSGLLLVGVPAALSNLLPFLGLDGQRMLEHAIGIHGLGRSAFEIAKRLVTGRKEELAQVRRGVIVWSLTYGIFASGTLLVGTVLIVGIWWHTLDGLWGPVWATGLLISEFLVLMLVWAALVAWRQFKSRRA